MRLELPTKTFQNQHTRAAYGFNGSAKISDIAELFPERDDPLVTTAAVRAACHSLLIARRAMSFILNGISCAMPIQILVVDDHELVRAGLRLHLDREEGLEVVAEAGEAASACALIAEKSPDLVVMDLELPGEDGLAATRTVKSRWPQTRVLVLTGRKPTHLARAALLAGADGLVFKSETREHLVRAVRTVAAGQVYLSPAAATALVATVRDPSNGAAGAGHPELSARERAVLKGLAEGLSYKELAADLGVSVKSADIFSLS